MPWIQVELDCQREALEPLEEVLWALGAVSVTYADAADQPVFEPKPGEISLWQAVRLVGLFEHDTDEAALSAALSALPEAGAVSLRRLEDQAWERAWMADFKPMRHGQRLWIVPHHHTPPDPAGVNLMLDPGLAFGTGSHPTTAMALTWLDGVIADNPRVMDYGCGSGVLAIAALLLGAQSASGVDIDPQAVTASRENAKVNGVSEHLTLGLPHEITPSPEFDVVVANILCDPLIELANTLIGFVRPGGLIAMTGVLAEQAERIIEAYRPHCELRVSARQDEWVLLEGQYIGE